ncbi:prion-like protein [Aphelenchoides avenae]|nr:prion-like protein [Aphelenchus avenae]
MPLGCPTCDGRLKKYEALVERLGGDIRIIVVAPAHEDSASVRQATAKYRRLDFLQEKEAKQIHAWLGANENDQFVFDRCSRLMKVIRHSSTEADDFHAVFNALHHASVRSECGYCRYDRNQELRQSQHRRFAESVSPTPEFVTPQITAYVVPQSPYDSRLKYIHRSTAPPPPRATPGTPNRPPPPAPTPNRVTPRASAALTTPYPYTRNNAATTTMSYQQQLEVHRQQIALRRKQYEEQLARRQQQSAPQTPPPPELAQQAAHNAPPNAAVQSASAQQERVQQQQRYAPQNTAPSDFGSRRVRTTKSPIVYSQDAHSLRYQYSLAGTRNRDAYLERERQKQQEQRRVLEEQQRRVEEARKARLEQQQIIQQQLAAAAAASAPPPTLEEQAEAAPLYPDGAENSDYYGDEEYSDWTTVIPQVQIPKPTRPPPSWPTRQPNTVTNYGFELPCAGYTDEICFQQYNNMAEEEVHQCCKERVTITDQCTPGKCSNVTQQLCCIQRFLQSKHKCCSDERQAEVTGPGDAFSRCCFEAFVNDDNECCPKPFAHEQWRSVHELCLPNVDADLSTVKVPTRLAGTTLITEFDFAKTDRWRFTCKYGGHVPQYSFFDESYNDDADERRRR